MSSNKYPGPYKAGHINCEGKPYIDGPGTGFGYHAGYLFGRYAFETFEQAEVVADMMNRAFAEGSGARAREIKEALGI